MTETDRYTGISGDQIKDHSINPSEFNTTGNIKTPKKWQLLAFDLVNDKMKWVYNIGNKIFK